MGRNNADGSGENRCGAQPLGFCVKSCGFENGGEIFCVHVDLEPLISAVVVVDNDNLVTYLNKAAAKQIGVDQKVALGSEITSLYQTVWLSSEDEHEAQNSLEKKGYWTGENMHVKKNGEKIKVESTVIALKDAAGRKIGLLNVMRDVTHQKQVEVELRESEARFRTIVEHSPAVITVVDGNYRVVYANPSLEHIIGIPPSAIVGKKWAEIDMPQCVHQALIKIAQRVFATGKTVNWEQTVPTPLGVRTLETYVVPQVSKDGTIETLMGITVDITEHKQMEKLLKGYSRDLEILVKNAAEKLLESERFAAIGQTAGMVGHDIRNPLQSIAGELYLQKRDLEGLLDSEIKRNLRESISVVEEQVAYISKIVSDLQDFAKPTMPQYRKVDFEKILQSVLSTINIPESIAVSYSTCKELSKFITDQDHIKRALTNLILNAVQAMPNGGQLKINATYEAQTAIITIEDTGEGISEEVRDKIFKPLFTTKAKGQGFGLAVVKRLTELLGGNVTFESTKGKGTKFTLRIPQRAV